MNFFKICLVISIGIFVLTGCNTLGYGIKGPGASSPKAKYQKPGPPPHAPAHGYRHKHHGQNELIYDSKIGAYIVLNIPETYFGNNLYIRMSTDGRWLVSATSEGGWRVAVGNEVPYKLKADKKKKKAKKGKAHKKKK